MQYFVPLALLTASLAVASPVDNNALFERHEKHTKCCCSKGKTDSCSTCEPSEPCPSSGGDSYTNCSYDQQIGLVNLYICDVLNNLNLSIPVTVSVPITL